MVRTGGVVSIAQGYVLHRNSALYVSQTASCGRAHSDSGRVLLVLHDVRSSPQIPLLKCSKANRIIKTVFGLSKMEGDCPRNILN